MDANILVLDDDPSSRQTLVGSLRAFDCCVVAPEGPFRTVSVLQEFARREGVTHLVTDQRLTERRFSDFLGAKAAAAVFGLNIAPILVTAYAMQDMDRDIRPYLASIPRIVHRSLSSPEVLIEALYASGNEVHRGEIARARRKCRCIVKIEEKVRGQCEDDFHLRLLIRQWRKDETVGFPCKALPKEIQEISKPGSFFVAQVNIEATDNASVFLTDFELLPQDDSDDI